MVQKWSRFHVCRRVSPEHRHTKEKLIERESWLGICKLLWEVADSHLPVVFTKVKVRLYKSPPGKSQIGSRLDWHLHWRTFPFHISQNMGSILELPEHTRPVHSDGPFSAPLPGALQTQIPHFASPLGSVCFGFSRPGLMYWVVTPGHLTQGTPDCWRANAGPQQASHAPAYYVAPRSPVKCSFKDENGVFKSLISLPKDWVEWASHFNR